MKNYKVLSERRSSVFSEIFSRLEESPSQEIAEITTDNVLAGGHIKQVLFSGQRQQVWKQILCKSGNTAVNWRDV